MVLSQRSLRLFQRTEINYTGLTPAPAAIVAALLALAVANTVAEAF